MSFAISSNKPLPMTKAKRALNDKIRRTFRAYQDAYERLYVRRPVSIEHKGADLYRVTPGNEVMSLKRMKELTRSMNDRHVE